MHEVNNPKDGRDGRSEPQRRMTPTLEGDTKGCKEQTEPRGRTRAGERPSPPRWGQGLRRGNRTRVRLGVRRVGAGLRQRQRLSPQGANVRPVPCPGRPVPAGALMRRQPRTGRGSRGKHTRTRLERAPRRPAEVARLPRACQPVREHTPTREQGQLRDDSRATQTKPAKKPTAGGRDHSGPDKNHAC